MDTHDYSFDGRSQKVCGHSSRNPPSSFFFIQRQITIITYCGLVLEMKINNNILNLYLLFSYRVGQEHMLMLLMFMIWEPHYCFLKRLYNNREYILFIITRKKYAFHESRFQITKSTTASRRDMRQGDLFVLLDKAIKPL